MEQSVSTRIVEAIADAEGRDPANLDFTLQDYIDTDALRMLLEHKSDTWTITFDVANHEVILTGAGIVTVEEKRSEVNV